MGGRRLFPEPPGDGGGVWIVTGWVLGLLLWCGVLLTWYAGFTPAAPFVVIPVVLVILIGAGNLLGGRSRRKPPQFNRPDAGPPSSSNGAALDSAELESPAPDSPAPDSPAPDSPAPDAGGAPHPQAEEPGARR